MRPTLSLFGLALLVSTVPAIAVPQAAPGGKQPSHHDSRPILELATSLPGEGHRAALETGRLLWDQPSRALLAGHQKLGAEFGSDFRAAYDSSSGLLRRAYGPGIYHAGSVGSEQIALRAAQAMIERHVQFLAPGAQADEFVLVANDLDANVRTLGFAQTRAGLRIEGARLNFRFKKDRLYVIGAETVASKSNKAQLVISHDIAKERALANTEAEFGPAQASDVRAAVFFPVHTQHGTVLRAALPVTVALRSGPLRYEVFVDAESGDILARKQLIRFESATVLGHVPERSPSFGGRIDVPLALTSINVGGAAQKTGLLGEATFSGPTAALEVLMVGDRVRVQNDSGPEATFSTTVNDGQSFIIDQAGSELLDAQVTTYVHSALIREFARTFAPTLGFLNQQVQATVNINDQCNAFSDGTSINFFRAGGGCENTGLLADVVYHEYGHSLHAHAIIEGVGAFDGALGEGAGDFIAATYTGDPGTARGFFLDSQPLRDLDPPNKENSWPADLVGEVHYDGLIIGQALWDMRKELVTKLGQAEGVARANSIFYQGLRRASDIPTMHFEVLAADDDDGDLSNGTPNVCEINRAFARHGLLLVGAKGSTLGVTPANQNGFQISVELTGLFEQCSTDQVASATLSWQERGAPGNSGTLPMAAAGNVLNATIPSQDDGSVVRYGVSISFSDGGILNLPDNKADTFYEFFVGETVPLYCTDFETDPATDGWTHGLAEGETTEGADDWNWGKPKGSSSNGDPVEAFSGERVIGNDLVPQQNFNGLYQPDKTNFMKSPVINSQGYQTVRLQYRRWLNVEDAFFDQATIHAGDQQLWSNANSNQGTESRTHHQDREWRFHDVDLSEAVDGDGNVQVTFQLKSDAGLELGGWTIDDFCVVGIGAAVDPCAGGGCGGQGVGGAGGGGPGDNANDDLEPGGGCGCVQVGQAPIHSGFAWLGVLGMLGAALRLRRKKH